MVRQNRPVPPPPLVRKVRFDVRPWTDGSASARELLPYIDNVSLLDLVSAFEHAAAYDVPGGYAGLILDHFDFGDLTAYLNGRPDSANSANSGPIPLLGCNCGELGCWPLEARVLVDDNLVTWQDFAQPHRPKRDYGSFGPFTFHRTQYDQAVREAVAAAFDS